MSLSSQEAPHGQIAGYAQAVSHALSHAVTLDESVSVHAVIGKRRPNTIVAMPIEQVYFFTISFMPPVTQHDANSIFQRDTRFLNDWRGPWYYSCYVVDDIAMRGLSLGNVMWIPGMFAGARLQ
jgi:hypothetical protein